MSYEPPSDPPSEPPSDFQSGNTPRDFSSDLPSDLPSELNSTLGSSPRSSHKTGRSIPGSSTGRSTGGITRNTHTTAGSEPPSSPTSSLGFSESSSQFPLPTSPSRAPFPSQNNHLGAQHGNAGENEDVGDEIRRAATIGLEGIPKVIDAVGETVQKEFEKFLRNYVEAGERYYVEAIASMLEQKTFCLYVDWNHLERLSVADDVDAAALPAAIKGQYYRFLPCLLRGLRNVIKEILPRVEAARADSRSVASNQDASHTNLSESDSSKFSNSHDGPGPVYQLAFYDLNLRMKLRDLRTETVGMLIAFTGTVTRTSEVRPELYRGTFKCESCLTEVSDVEQSFKYTTPYMCPNPTCQNRTSWQLVPAKSQFMDWQRVRVQENPGDIPTGSMPRTIDVILRGECVEKAKAGDRCIFSGTQIVVPDVSQLGLPGFKATGMRDRRGQGRGEGMDGAVTGLKALGARDLTYRLAFVACTAQTDDNNGSLGTLHQLGIDNDLDHQGNDLDEREAYIDTLEPEEFRDLQRMTETENLYRKLVDSIAPAVFGHDSIKRGILLQLLGGVHKTTPEGIQLRGDINLCIVGDPSTSKSQFLKYVTGFLPRSVYTSGKASSAAGLTAAVVKDEETAEFTIEAGALMLADNGICAIDEFDKMDLVDQVAIHEAMEQQTISIAKAGIHATLNARTSILAAANPINGRYNKKYSLRTNVNMSAPIMSRFDLFFIVLDECNAEVDARLADHIVDLHMDGDNAIDPPFSTRQLLRYINYARLFKPKFSEGAKKLLIHYYKSLREDDILFASSNPATQNNHGGTNSNVGRTSYRITVRQLESLIRLSEAIARAHCLEIINEQMVSEAHKLLKDSVIRVDHEDVILADDHAPLTSQRYIDRSGQRDFFREAEGEESQGRKTMSQEEFELWSKRLGAQVAFRTNNQNADDDIDNEGVDGNELITWYLDAHGESIIDEEEIDSFKKTVERVLRIMVRNNVLMELRGRSDNPQDTENAPQSVKYVIHPNSTFFFENDS